MSANLSIFIPHAGCPHTCSFCDQRLIAGSTSQPSAEEVSDIIAAGAHHAPKDTQIAFFGGSFTAIDREYMLSLLRAAEPFVKNGLFSGIRISTRPDCIDTDMLKLLKSHCVAAIELGAQSMSDAVLSANGRGHTAADVVRAARLIHDSGIELGVQMMTGLYKSTLGLDRQTARALIALKPRTARIYPLVVLRGTKLHTLMQSGKFAPLDIEKSVELAAEIKDAFLSAGIDVIRTGLHTVDQSSVVGGAFHPAFGELVEARRMLHEMLSGLSALPKLNEYTIYVPRNRLSQYLGQHRGNIEKLKSEGYLCRILTHDESGVKIQATE